MAATRMTAERVVLKATIIERFLTTNVSQRRIADDLGCDYTFVNNVLVGVPRPPHRVRPKPTPPTVNKELRNQQIAVLADSGMGLAEIAERFDITRQSASRIAKGMGCPPRFVDGRNWQFDARNRQMRAARVAGEPVAEIAARFGLSESYTWKIVAHAKG